MAEANWAGSRTYGERLLHRPRSVEELCAVVAAAPQIRVLGSRHAFNAITDAEELVSLDGLPREVTVDGASVTCCGAVRYGELAAALAPHGLALHNLASLPHIAVAGAIATATHGSGSQSGNLATAVRGLELVTSDGSLVRVARGEPDFDGMVVGLGALGAVTRVTLDVEPAYQVAQRVYEGLTWDALHAEFDAIMAAGHSVSVFTHWGDAAGSAWVKRRDTDFPERVAGAWPATVERHPIVGLDPVNCTQQLGVPGGWSDRLPHFRMGFTPSAGAEIQSEYLLPRAHAGAAIEALRGCAAAIDPVLQVSEIRTVASDDLWMSPEYGRETVAVHFTWERDPEAVQRAVAVVEDALADLDPRPHWGKLFITAPPYERGAAFAALASRLDPRGAFRNAWLERHVIGSADGNPDRRPHPALRRLHPAP